MKRLSTGLLLGLALLLSACTLKGPAATPTPTRQVAGAFYSLPVPANGYVLLNKEQISLLLNQPENKGKMVLFGGPTPQTKLVYYLPANGKAAVLTVSGLASNDIFLPALRLVSLGRTSDNYYGMMDIDRAGRKGALTVYFGLNETDKLDQEVGARPLGTQVYKNAQQLDVIPELRETGPYVIEVGLDEAQPLKADKADAFFREQVLLTQGDKVVFLQP